MSYLAVGTTVTGALIFTPIYHQQNKANIVRPTEQKRKARPTLAIDWLVTLRTSDLSPSSLITVNLNFCSKSFQISLGSNKKSQKMFIEKVGLLSPQYFYRAGTIESMLLDLMYCQIFFSYHAHANSFPSKLHLLMSTLGSACCVCILAVIRW